MAIANDLEADWKRSFRETAEPAIAQSKSIDEVVVADNCLDQAAAVFRRHFNGATAVIVADETTFALAGTVVRAALEQAGTPVSAFVLPAKPRLAPDRAVGDRIADALRQNGEPGAAVAVGSGVIHDLTRYGAFQAGVPFMSVPTAASMDGYTSAGAPLSDKGFKITLQCAPPRAILADLAVVAAAPPAMSGWGFGDLAGKMPAAGDWLVADALGVEPLDDVAWPMVQDNLRQWLSDPAGVRRGDRDAIANLFVGLTVSGVAMELHGSSRPASGADHQIAHIWEMEYLQHRGEKVSHGACVSIGCLSMLALFDWMIAREILVEEAGRAAAGFPDWSAEERHIGEAFPDVEIAGRAIIEARAKHLDGEALAGRLRGLADGWPSLRKRLAAHLMREREMRALLETAGAPSTVAAIGLTPGHHRDTILKARWIRRRYTALDMLAEAGLLERAVAETFHDAHPLYR